MINLYDLGLVRAIGDKELESESQRHTRNAQISQPSIASFIKILTLDSSEFTINGKHKEIDIMTICPEQ